MGPQCTSIIMGLQDYVKKVDRAHTIQTGIWPRSSGAIRISSTKLARSSNYTNDRMRHSTGEIELVNGHGGRLDLSRIPPTSLEIKGQILA
jgi:hypothetical protein